MGRKRKNPEEATETSIDVVEMVVKGPKVPFSTWFDKKVKEGKVRAHQDAAVLVFLKKQGLKESESADDYNRAFARF